MLSDRERHGIVALGRYLTVGKEATTAAAADDDVRRAAFGFHFDPIV